MNAKLLCRLSALSAAAVFLLSACTSSGGSSEDALTCSTWNGYSEFLSLAEKKCRNVELEISPYAGASRSDYGWSQMRGDDIPDIFITSHVRDGDLARKRLADLSDFDFVSNIPSAILEQASIDGGVYLLPVNSTVHGIYYNKTLMEENNWEVPTDFSELKSLCARIKAAGMTPGLVGTKLHDDPFSAVFNLARTGWLSTPEGAQWERDFLSGEASATGMWEDTMDYVQQYIDIGMFSTDPEDRDNKTLIEEEMGNRRVMFCTSMLDVTTTTLPNGDELGMMPYISQNGNNNRYIYNPASYIGISSRLTQPGNEKKLEHAIELLSLLYSPEGQNTFITNLTPCGLSIVENADIPEDSLVRGAHQALCQGQVYPVTYTSWEQVLYDIGRGYKLWFRGEEDLDGQNCITLMDVLQTGYLNDPDNTDICEVTTDFTLEETAVLAGKALGSFTGADAAMIPFAPFYKKGDILNAGISARLYKGTINAEGALAVSPGYDGETAVLTMTGAQARELAEKGFDIADDKEPYPYVLVTKGGKELEDDQTYQIAFLMRGYTREVGELYHARIEENSFQSIFRDWLRKQETVSPDGNPWN